MEVCLWMGGVAIRYKMHTSVWLQVGTDSGVEVDLGFGRPVLPAPVCHLH